MQIRVMARLSILWFCVTSADISGVEAELRVNTNSAVNLARGRFYEACWRRGRGGLLMMRQILSVLGDMRILGHVGRRPQVKAGGSKLGKSGFG
jgi:hypothetical protein